MFGDAVASLEEFVDCFDDKMDVIMDALDSVLPMYLPLAPSVGCMALPRPITITATVALWQHGDNLLHERHLARSSGVGLANWARLQPFSSGCLYLNRVVQMGV